MSYHLELHYIIHHELLNVSCMMFLAYGATVPISPCYPSFHHFSFHRSVYTLYGYIAAVLYLSLYSYVCISFTRLLRLYLLSESLHVIPVSVISFAALLVLQRIPRESKRSTTGPLHCVIVLSLHRILPCRVPVHFARLAASDCIPYTSRLQQHTAAHAQAEPVSQEWITWRKLINDETPA